MKVTVHTQTMTKKSVKHMSKIHET